MGKRGNVWIGVAGIVIVDDRWLVVKKRYGGLKGKWSLPAGFVDEGETMDEAVMREVKEETGIDTRIVGLVGMRSGVLKEQISDNLIIFKMEAIGGSLVAEEKELYEAAFLSTEQLLKDHLTSVLLRTLIEKHNYYSMKTYDSINPGDIFGYSSYKLFL